MARVNKNLFIKIIIKIIIIFLIFSFCFLFLFFVKFIFLKNNESAVIFFNVGQGDSILLRNINGKNILIDGGPDNLVLKKLGKFLPYFSRRLDIVILSHYHDDHLIGLIEVARRYQVEVLLLGDNLTGSNLQNLLLELVYSSEGKILNIENQQQIILGECILSFLNPLSLGVKDNDNNSLITKFNCPKIKFLFSGDNEKEVEQILVSKNFDLNVDVFKASHHGSKTSNIKEFLLAISPIFFVISVGDDNRFNHPAQTVINLVKDLGLTIKRTDVEGDLIFLLD